MRAGGEPDTARQLQRPHPPSFQTLFRRPHHGGARQEWTVPAQVLKVYATPRRPFKARLDQELKLIGEYRLQNKREVRQSWTDHRLMLAPGLEGKVSPDQDPLGHPRAAHPGGEVAAPAVRGKRAAPAPRPHGCAGGRPHEARLRAQVRGLPGAQDAHRGEGPARGDEF